MSEWCIRVIGKNRKEIDKHLLVQAVLALSRQLKQQQTDKRTTAEAPEETA